METCDQLEGAGHLYLAHRRTLRAQLCPASSLVTPPPQRGWGNGGSDHRCPSLHGSKQARALSQIHPASCFLCLRQRSWASVPILDKWTREEPISEKRAWKRAAVTESEVVAEARLDFQDASTLPGILSSSGKGLEPIPQKWDLNTPCTQVCGNSGFLHACNGWGEGPNCEPDQRARQAWGCPRKLSAKSRALLTQGSRSSARAPGDPQT